MTDPLQETTQHILKHIPAYGVLLCTICEEPHCVPPNSLREHFKTFHSDSVSKTQRKAIIKHALKDELLDPNEVKVIMPPFKDGPIGGLHKTYGYECTVCKKLLPKVSSMKPHCRLHGWKVKQPPMWTRDR